MRPSLLIAALGVVVALLAFAWFAADSSPTTESDATGSSSLLTAPGGDDGADGPRSPASLLDAPPPVVEPAVDPTLTIWPLRGRCLAKEGDTPLAGIEVDFASPDGPEGRATTDEDGRFDLRFEATDEVYANAVPRRGWVPVGPPLLLTEAQRRGTEDIVLYLDRGTSAPVSGVVLDAESGEPVFEVQVTVRQAESGLQTMVTTDAEGAFATTMAFPPGELEAVVSDMPEDKATSVGSFRRPHIEEGREPPPWILEVNIGPTYFVRPTGGPPPPDGGWHVRIVEGGLRGAYAAVIAVHEDGFQLLRNANGLDRGEREALEARIEYLQDLGYAVDPADMRFEDREYEVRNWPPIPVRDGPTPWARYPRQLFPPAPTSLPRLVMENATAEWWGEVPLQRTVGQHPGILYVPVRPNGGVSGVVTDEAGVPVAAVDVVIDPLPPVGESSIHGTTTDADGVYRFRDIDVGRYHLAVRPVSHEASDYEILVDAGGNPIAPILVPEQEIMGTISGVLIAGLDADHGTPVVELAPKSGTSFSAVAMPRGWSRSRRNHKATFEFRNVPSGTYEVFVSGHAASGPAGDIQWNPPVHTVSSARGDLRFVARTDPRAEPHVLSVLDDAGFAVPDAKVIFGPGSWFQGCFSLGDETAFLAPRGAPLRWMVVAPGMRPQWGTEKAFSTGGQALRADVRMPRGWGATIYLRRTIAGREREIGRWRDAEAAALFHAAAPVIGAKVYADGKYLGASNREGRLDLEAKERPERLQVDYPGLEAGMIVAPGWGEIAERHVAVVWLAPRD